MGIFSSKKLYENVFEKRTEDVKILRVKITFVNGESCHINISGYLSSSIRVSNPLNEKYLVSEYTITTAREALHNFIDNVSDYIVSDEDEYFNLKENPIRKLKVITESPKQEEIKIYVGTHEVGADDE